MEWDSRKEKGKAQVNDSGSSSVSHLLLNVRERALRGDINKDGICDILDVATAAIAFGCVPEDLRWDERADVDGNGIVNILDIAVIAVDFGKKV